MIAPDLKAHLVAVLDRRVTEANATPEGADHRAILADVAEEVGVSLEDLRDAWNDSRAMAGAG